MFILILNQTFRVIFLSVPHTLACSLLVLHNKLHTSYLKISSDVWDKSASRAKALFTDPPKLYWQVYHFCLNLLKYSLRGLRRFRLYFTVYPNSSHSTDIINFLIWYIQYCPPLLGNIERVVFPYFSVYWAYIVKYSPSSV